MLSNRGVGEDSSSPLDSKEIQPVHAKGNKAWIFIGRTDAEAETPKLWLPDENSLLIGNDPDAGKNWGQDEKGMTEDEMDGITDSMNMSLSNSGRWWRTGKPVMLQSMGWQRVRYDLATEQQQQNC